MDFNDSSRIARNIIQAQMPIIVNNEGIDGSLKKAIRLVIKAVANSIHHPSQTYLLLLQIKVPLEYLVAQLANSMPEVSTELARGLELLSTPPLLPCPEPDSAKKKTVWTFTPEHSKQVYDRYPRRSEALTAWERNQ